MRKTAPDFSDPAARAAARLDGVRRRDRTRRVGAAVGLAVAAVALPPVAGSVTSDSGAAVGGVLAGMLLLALAVAVWPYRWYRDEQCHRELEAIWRELRTDADEPVTCERCAAWAEAEGVAVKLLLIRCAAAGERIGGAPSPYSREFVRSVDAGDVTAAAEAMEELRARAAERELESRRRYSEAQEAAVREAHERALRDVEEAGAAELQEREQRLARDLAEQEQAEREAQADAVAKALRRP